VLWPAAAIRYRTLLLIMVNRGVVSRPGRLHRMIAACHRPAVQSQALMTSVRASMSYAAREERGASRPPRRWSWCGQGGVSSGSAGAARVTVVSAPGSALIRELTAAPDLDGWAIV
jgi:hypothetical protein